MTVTSVPAPAAPPVPPKADGSSAHESTAGTADDGFASALADAHQQARENRPERAANSPHAPAMSAGRTAAKPLPEDNARQEAGGRGHGEHDRAGAAGGRHDNRLGPAGSDRHADRSRRARAAGRARNDRGAHRNARRARGSRGRAPGRNRDERGTRRRRDRDRIARADRRCDRDPGRDPGHGPGRRRGREHVADPRSAGGAGHRPARACRAGDRGARPPRAGRCTRSEVARAREHQHPVAHPVARVDRARCRRDRGRHIRRRRGRNTHVHADRPVRARTQVRSDPGQRDDHRGHRRGRSCAGSRSRNRGRSPRRPRPRPTRRPPRNSRR